MAAEASAQETRRLAVFDRYAFMTEMENETLSEICILACGLFDVEFAQVTILGADTGYFLTRNRLDTRSFRRANGFTDRAFQCDDVLIVPDALADPRYADLPDASLHKARFFGGAPLTVAPGISLGVLSIFDKRPHLEFRDGDRAHFRRLAALTVNELKRQRGIRELTRARDEANEASLAKSTFLATVSHEIRTPLNGVLGMAEIMAADPLPDQQRERLGILRQSGETLLALLNDILDLSKIEAGRLTLERIAFDLRHVADGAFAGFSSIAREKGLAYKLLYDQGLAPRYIGDSTRVRQILCNLISNALKFTSQGGVTVTVSEESAGLVLSVADTGIGISGDAIARLFQKFSQADESTTRRYGGTGLGLSICRELADAMGGAITVSSQEDRGTTFTVTLPLEKAQDDAPAARPKAEKTADAPATALKVLAAEDNEINRRVLAAFLSKLGIHPTIVSDGRQAVEHWEKEPWDVILMDIQMPEMDGRQATAAIRARETETGRGRTPIVALSADVMTHHLEEYGRFDIDGVLAKPINSGLLAETMRRFMGT
jgi:signal transduction histidine kinase